MLFGPPIVGDGLLRTLNSTDLPQTAATAGWRAMSNWPGLLAICFWAVIAGALPLCTFGADSVVVFNEVNYHPAIDEGANEWVELHNQMAIDIDLSAWSISGTIGFMFVEGTIIPAGGYLVIASDPANLAATTGLTNVLGPFSGRLNNSSGTLRLRDRNDRLMDQLDYSDGGKWPVAADGSGATLAKRDPDASSDAPENWTSSVLAGGTPGARNFPAPILALRRSLVQFNGLWRYEASGTDLGSGWRDPAFDDSSWAGRNAATLLSYWPFDGNATATRGANGTLVGVISGTSDRNGVAGGALAFSGSQYVSVAGGGGLNAATAGTVSMWVKWTGTQDADCCGTFGAVLARQSNGQFSDDILALNAADPSLARLVWRQSGGPAPTLITSTAVVGTSWHHIAVTFAASGSTLYVDGVAQGTAIGSGMNNNSATPLSIGAWAGDGGGFSTASIDDVAIWDQPLTAAQITQLANQTKAPLDFGGAENAVYFAGNAHLTGNDELRHTPLPLGPTTYYFRNSFVFGDEPSNTELKLDLAVDDGAVFYLNGVEAYRQNMPGGQVGYSTLAATAVSDASILNSISFPATNLIHGTNVLAVEVHQAVVGDSDMIFGAGLGAVITPTSAAESRTLVALRDSWKFDASDVDPAVSWTSVPYNDSSWSNGVALFFAGNGAVDGVPPELISGVTAAASSEYTPDGRLAMHVVDGAGLIGNTHVNTPGGTMWLNTGTFALPNDLNPQITFDLGSVQPIHWLKVWNYNEDIPGRPELLLRGVSSADILVAGVNGVFANLVTGQAFNKGPGTQTDFSQLIDLGGVQARYLRLDKLTNFPGGDFQFVGLSEVQFLRDAELNRTEAPLGPTTYYFRKTFNFVGDPTRATLFLNAAIDDGAVFYLNGSEIQRINMPGGAVTRTTLANAPVGHATFTGSMPVSSAHLLNGTNVLSVEVHQAAATGDTDMIFGAELRAEIIPLPASAFSSDGIVFNEISAGGTQPFKIELLNTGAEDVDLGGYVVVRHGFTDTTYTLSSETLHPGQTFVLDGLVSAAPHDKLFLFEPGERQMVDAVEVHEPPRARWPDGTGDWLTPAATSFGASNTVTLHDEVVINEIMYHAPPTLELPPVIGSNTFISLTNFWRYEQSGTDLGTAWRAPAYDDSAWPSGRALLYVSTNNLPVAKNTQLTLGPTTYYFRTSFVYTGAPTVLSLNVRHVIDDGAVFYFNGNEIIRFRMPTGTIRYTNNASAATLNATLLGPFTISLTNLLIGTNVLAVEVHQAVAAGNDIAFAMELNAVVEAIPRVPFSESPEQWVELLNRSSNAVDLTGWRLDEAIDYRFPSNTMIAPGGYLVAANDPAALLAKFPGISVVGPYANSLSHHGGRIVLKDAADNPANFVKYFDDGRWPIAADAGGASLELRDPRADNSAAEAWNASDERSRSGWRTYSYRGVAAASPVGPDGQWHEFVIGLLNAGEVLLDDISVIETPSTTPTNLIQNGTFTTGTNKWRIIGNHHGEVIDDPDQPGNKVLRLVATGATEHMSNHGETTFVGNRDVVNGREYLISFRAKWISGSRQFHTRLYFNRLARTTLIDIPALHGTPGAQNSTFAANIGPTYSDLRHDPAVPAPFAPVTVSVKATDPDGVASLTLWSEVDGGTWSSSPMTISPDGKYTGTLPGKAGGTIVQFYVDAVDGLGAHSFFPAAGPNSRVLYKVDDGLAQTNGLHNVRLIMLTADADSMFRTVNLMSNDRIGGTMIYDENEIFYDAGMGLKGSEHSRTTTPRLGFHVVFSSEHSFRGIHGSVAIDRSESVGYGQREMLHHQTLNHAGGTTTKYHDLIHVMAPRPDYTGGAELQLARYTSVFLDDQYDHGSDGTVFEYELVYQLNPPTDDGTPEGNKIPAPDSVVGTNIRNLGDDKEGYRWDFLIKNNEDRDDYSRLILFCKTMEMSGTAFTSQITNIVDMDAWLRGAAVNALVGIGDSYGGDGSQHNVQFYFRPSDGKAIYFPHDMDAFFDVNRGIVPNGELTKMLTVPAWARTYYGNLLDIIATTYNGTYMTRWANQFKRLLPAQDFAGHFSFIIQRASIVTGMVNAQVPNALFAITSNNGNDFSASSNSVTISGTAPLSVKTIEVNGVSYPINWTSTTAWSLSVPLFAGPNLLALQGVGFSGARLGTAVDSITITNTGPAAPSPVVINEWMADNAAPSGFADPTDGLFQDWFELYNPNAGSINLGGFFLTDNLSQPTKWQIPANTMIAGQGFLLVWADNQPLQNGTGTDGDLHAAFQLNNGGEAIGLFSPNGVLQHGVTFGQQIQNVSQGLFPDGNTNGYHFMTSWTPRAANIVVPLQIIDLSFNGATVTISWSAIPSRAYQVEYKDDLDEAAWKPLGNEVSAANDTASTTDFLPSGSHRFYRIVQLN